MIDRHSIEQVVDRVDIVDVVSRYVDLKRQGSNYVACCPFHNERTPSFVVNPSRNTWHCFGACNEGGNAISFVMHYCHLNFPEAVRELAKMVGVQLDETEEKGKTAEQKMNELKRESMFAAYRSLQPFFVEQLEGDSGESRQAKAYATKRWNADFVRETGIGYAPRDSRALIDFAKRHNVPENILLELGVLRKSEKDGRLYAFFRERIMIPIRDRFSRIIGYTARYIGDSPDTAKYLNSATSLIYSKESSIFGIHIALRTAAKENKFYLVEGAPDVLQLQQIGTNNAIASLGSAWTEKQLSQIKRYTSNLCFLPDADPPKPGEQYGTGIVSVIKNGLLAFRLGFNITVKEIPPAGNGAKNDPDSYCRSRAIVSDIDEKDFIVWYARKLFAGSLTQEQKRNAVTAIASLIAQIEDEVKQSMYLESVAKIEGSKSLWKTAIKKQQQASQAQGYAEGGFTRPGRVDEVAGVVHAGEWVASQRLLASPVARPLIEALDYAQRTNTIGSLRQTDVSRTITAPAVLAQSQAPMVIVQENNALRETLARLNERLNEPFVTVNTVTGDLGIKQAQDDYQRLMNNKSPKNKRK